MTIDFSLERADWIRLQVGQVPHLIEHIRSQRVPSMQANRGPRISGGGDRARAPIQLDPLDDADELWAAVCAIADELAERTSSRAPVSRSSVWVRAAGGVRQVYGFGTTDSDEIYRAVFVLCAWLRSHALTLALGDPYREPVDLLAAQVRSMRGKYPDAPEPFRLRMRCPKCGEHAVTKTYDLMGELESLVCEACGARRIF